MVSMAGNTREFVIPIDEDVATIGGSTGFFSTNVSINPGNPVMFPFASRVAQNYERYEFLELCFEYRPSVSVFATEGQQGFVGIAATMDAVQAPPLTQAQADVLYHAPVVETAKPTRICLPKSFLQSKSPREKFFVRQNGNIPGGNDPHTYDCGQMFFWTNGQAASSPCGIIRVIGKCRLSNPANDIGGNAAPNFNTSLFHATNVAATAGVSQNIPFANTDFNNNLITLDGTNSVFTLPPGNYLIDAAVDLDGSTAGTGVSLSCSLFINGISWNASAFTSVCPVNTGALLPHAQVSFSWFARSNGNTTVSVHAVPIATGGTLDFDAIVRFVSV